MAERLERVGIGRYVLQIGAPGGTRLQSSGSTTDADGLAEAVAEPREHPGEAGPAGVVDALEKATARAEEAMGHLRAAVEGTTFDAQHLSGSIDLILEVIQRLDREGRLEDAVRLARTLNALLALLRRWSELVRSLDIVLDAATRASDDAVIAWVEHELGTLHLAAGDLTGAERRLSEAERIRRRIRDEDGLSATAQNLSQLCQRLRELLREEDAEPSQIRGRRWLVAVLAALLLLLVGGVAGAMIDPLRDDGATTDAGARVNLTVGVEGPGAVTSRPSGIRCSDRCNAQFRRGQSIRLIATPDRGGTLVGWRGACQGTGPCRPRLRRDRVAVATFSRRAGPSTFTLTVDPPSNGKVTSVPPGLNCAPDCSGTFARSEEVTLTPEPDTGYTLETWGGDCRGKRPCVIAMNADHNVSAAFVAISTPPPTVTITVALLPGSGRGAVEAEGMTCTATACSGSFPRSTGTVTLTAVPEEGDALEGWGPECDGTASTCVLSLEDDHDASVTFSHPVE